MRTPGPILLASLALLSIAGCGRDATAPLAPAARVAAAGGLFTEIIPPAEDSVAPGYGGPCGGIEYERFEYDPATGTEYVVCADTTADTTTWRSDCPALEPGEAARPTCPTPPPPPPPTTQPAPTTTTPSQPAPTPPPPSPIVPQDSVESGYGSDPTGGIEYRDFEYEPDTGTEYVATPDTTPPPPAPKP